jgi:hypothetical protein
MTEPTKPRVGAIVWTDLTVADADALRDFYGAVVGWEARGEKMGGYEDYSMLPPGAAEPVTGICHARGVNADLPPQWLIYISVDDVDAAAAKAVALGGAIVSGPRALGGGRFAVIRDPAGAVCALYRP